MIMFQNWWDQVQVLVVSKGLLLILAVVIFLVGRCVIGALMKLAGRVMERGSVELSLRGFISNALRVCLYLVLVLVILQVVGYEVSSFAAILASAGVTVGLALQGSLSNLAGGILILLMRPFRVGDYINAGGYGGTVKEIGLVYTTLMTVDNHKIAIPNGTLSAGSIENFSTQTTRRVDVQVNVSYAANLRQAMEIFRQVLLARPEGLTDPAIDVVVAQLGEANVVLEGRLWVNASDYWPVLSGVRQDIKNAYDAAGIRVGHTRVEMLEK